MNGREGSIPHMTWAQTSREKDKKEMIRMRYGRTAMRRLRSREVPNARNEPQRKKRQRKKKDPLTLH